MERAFYAGSGKRRKIVKIVEGRPPEDFIGARPQIDSIGGLRVDARRRRLLAVSLVGIQGQGYGRVVAAALSPALDAVTRTEILESAHPLFDGPTTGAVVGSWIYIVANSQLWYPREPRETIILKVPLR